jgi:hypothetical protein
VHVCLHIADRYRNAAKVLKFKIAAKACQCKDVAASDHRVLMLLYNA